MFVLWAVTRPDTLTNCIIASKPANGRRRHRVAVVTPRVHFSLPFFLQPRQKPSGRQPDKATARLFAHGKERKRKQEGKI